VQRQLTDAFVRSAKPPAAGRLEISDSRCVGLVLRITPNGVKSWSYRFRDKTTGHLTRATIGQYPEIGLTTARASADAMRRTVAEGANPVEQKRIGRTKTFGGLAERYLAEHSRRRKRSHAGDDRNLRKHVLPQWRDRPYVAITRSDVIKLVEGLVTAGKPTLANRVHSLVSGIFTFGLDAGLVGANPCYRLKKRGVENIGRRVLSDPEIRLFWNGIVEPPRVRRVGLALRLALLTGARAGEVAGLSRAELDGLADASRSAWIISGTRTKNGKDHLIPLTPLARELILDLLAMIEPGEQFLLPPQTRRRGHMRPNSFAHAMVYFGRKLPDKETQLALPETDATVDAIRTWRADPPTPHDLRRTVGTRLAELRIPKEIRDRVLNHAAGDVGSRHYNLHDYAEEKREALSCWARALTMILDGTTAKVIEIAAARDGGRR
jgi:integrase